MQRPKSIAKAAVMLCLLMISTAADAQNDHTHQKKERKKEQSKEHKKDKVKAPTSDLPPIIWRDPAKISISNLIYGSGGIEHAPDPKSVYTFVNEDRAGSNPKFIVKDSKGVEWHVKIGSEPQSETAASRLLWAAGYFVDEDYYLPELTVRGLPKLHRGQKFVTRGEIVHGVRLKRKDHRIKKVGNWDWFQNPFVGTKEFNGLRVMMALLNNWDLKEINNAIYLVDGEQRYAVSDLGASFGKTGNIINRSRNDLEGYKGSKFIKTVRAEEVDFELHSRPFWPTAVDISNYKKRAKMEEVAKHIPRQDAKWLGQLLSRLSDRQIRDCFRAAGYLPEEVEGYSEKIHERIAALNEL